MRLPECEAGAKLEVGAKKTCVVADSLDPELDVESVKASVTPGGVPPGSPAGTEASSRQAVVEFRARDLGGSGLGTMSYRIMDPQVGRITPGGHRRLIILNRAFAHRVMDPEANRIRLLPPSGNGPAMQCVPSPLHLFLNHPQRAVAILVFSTCRRLDFRSFAGLFSRGVRQPRKRIHHCV